MTIVETASSPQHLMRIFAERAASGDSAGLLALYESSAVFEPQLGVVLRGHEEIREALEGLAAMKPRIEYNGAAAVVIVDDIALVSNAWTMSALLPDGSMHREGGISADVLRRQDDARWLVLIDQPRGATLAA